jgi:hypothetical protein
MTSYVFPTPRFVQKIIATQRKLHVQHSITATQAVKAFMIYKTGCFSVLVCRWGATIDTMCYKYTQSYKLTYLLNGCRLPVAPRLAVSLSLLKTSSYLCRYRPDLAIYLATELYLLLCSRNGAAVGRGSIATIVDLHETILVATVGVGQQ